MTLKAYMVQLATNLEALSAFVADPHRAADLAEVSKDEQAVLFSGDQNLIYATLTKNEEHSNER